MIHVRTWGAAHLLELYCATHHLPGAGTPIYQYGISLMKRRSPPATIIVFCPMTILSPARTTWPRYVTIFRWITISRKHNELPAVQIRSTLNAVYIITIRWASGSHINVLHRYAATLCGQC